MQKWYINGTKSLLFLIEYFLSGTGTKTGRDDLYDPVNVNHELK